MCPSGETTTRLTNPTPLPPLRLFGGKGGVGKTTCAAAAALAAASSSIGSGRRVLAVTTDPAPSLGDVFRADLTGEPRPVPIRRGTLLAAELAAGPAALSRWMAEHRESLREIAARGTYLDAEDVDRFLGLSLPGADELMAWLEVARLARQTACDEVVVDAAPTAHTLRLLAMPEAIRRFAGVLDRLQERHRWMAERFGGVWRPDESDALAADLAARGREVEERLRDPERCQVYWVMLPEILSLEETKDALAALDREGIPVREVIVNRVQPRDGEVIAEIRTALVGRTLRLLREEEKEPIGKVALRRVAKGLEAPLPEPSPPGPLSRPLPPSLTGRGGTRRGSLEWLDAIAPAGLQILFFGGKGGVGKTTCSAAVALALAERRPKDRILLISTDPAHSVADVLEVPLGDDERPIPGAPEGLRARELDAERAFAKWREQYRDKVDEAAGAFAPGFSPDTGGVQDLLDLTPPGIDELIAVSSLLDAVFGGGEEPAYDLVVVDTAPTGHALRLLEMPELALSWDHYLLSLLLKYREAVGLGDLAQELVALSRGLKRLEALLRDPARARFVAVTRAAELPRRETVRLLRSLKDLGITVPAVVVNAVPPEDCPRRGKALNLQGLGRCAIIKAPAEFPPPRGVARLSAWARSWEMLTG
ncbi:MAG TPA: ArsA family ATPase [Thermoanaerobaculia bacterium]|nr:ArsA family ATPase [Thermoanaerobaculia bacterium]